MRKHKETELVLETKFKRKSGRLYFLNKDGYLCEGRMGAIAGYEEGKVIHAKPKKLFKTNIQRKEGYLYFCKEGEKKPLEIWRTKMDRK
ncbi:uncharacterized protein METZ01_LOCUS402698 [marine metagenome]|uniref:Uncharacterized protein n=1 Tax=marine metagenome TaxID=408172 RepID=A0A382VTT4_9ZZZZ|tara:strand:+ start:8056 stop:8322 length:267 start_codon:yes stop_codon:yes gene_type:complete